MDVSCSRDDKIVSCFAYVFAEYTLNSQAGIFHFYLIKSLMSLCKKKKQITPQCLVDGIVKLLTLVTLHIIEIIQFIFLKTPFARLSNYYLIQKKINFSIQFSSNQNISTLFVKSALILNPLYSSKWKTSFIWLCSFVHVWSTI